MSTTTIELDLIQRKLLSLSDPTWIDNAIETMGEDKFWSFRNKVYALLDNLKVGECLMIDPRWNHKNIDFYIQISFYYISESNMCYCFNRNYTAVKRQFDQEEVTAIIERLKITRTQNLNNNV